MSRDSLVVLIVSEPGPMRDSLQMALTALCRDEAVGVAASAESALQVMAETPPALVICDADTAGNNIAGVLAAAAEIQGKSLVIADNREQQSKATAAGADVAVLKGYRASRVFEIVESLLCPTDAEPCRHGSNQTE